MPHAAPAPLAPVTRGSRARATLATLLLALVTLAGQPVHAEARAPAAPTSAAALHTVGRLTVDGTDTIEWSVVPADSDGPDGRVSLRTVVDPGASAEDAIAVTNLGASEAEFTVAAGDGVVGADGAFDIAPEEPVDSGSWIDVGGLDSGHLTLAGGETRVLPVTVRVPEQATPGDHPAGIVVGVSTLEGGVTITHRVGVRWHLQVAGELTPALQVTDVQTSYRPSWVPFAPGTVHVEYTVANVGNVRLGAAARTEAAGVAGLGAATARDDVAELLPTDAVSRSVELSAWPLLPLSGDLTVSALAVGEDAVALPPASVHGFTVVAVPWTGLALLAAMVAVVVIVRRRRMARASATALPGGGPQTSPAGP